jgi:hypothetical protein
MVRRRCALELVDCPVLPRALNAISDPNFLEVSY